MSSSANRRPRVAGQRRRPGTAPDARPGVDAGTGSDLAPSPHVPDGAGSDDAVSDEPAPADAHAKSDAEAADADAADPDLDDSDAGADPDVDDGADAPAARRRLLVPALALAASLVLLATVLFVTREDPAQRARDASAASATARSTLEQILSYNHATMTEQIPAGQALLTGTFKDEFATTMSKTIVPMAQKDKTVVKARAYEVGVMSQTDDSVTVQAFVNQARTSDAQKEPSIDQNRVIATMSRVGNRWLVSALKAY
ncbi:hypothetical protein LL946_12145 [Knoellia locipacati]|uniref:hypothetical protein n=1 Tax=Knoellia locipacati TaxID=882824 RepID=UPI00384C7748